jgi:hypothetical protein
VTDLLHKSNLHAYLDVVGVEVNLNIIRIPGWVAAFESVLSICTV